MKTSSKLQTVVAILEAIFYGRFSSDKQEGNDSEKRQRQAYETVLNRYPNRLKRSARYPDGFFDPAMSAFHGVNITEGFLGGLIEKAKSGELAGCCLVVDEISRFSRLDPDLATNLISQVVRSGVPIVVNSPDMFIDVPFLGSPMYLVLQFMIQQAHDKSATTSRHCKAAWQTIRETGEGTKTKGQVGKHPFWVSKVDGKFTRNEKAKLMETAIRMALDGKGGRLIEEATGLGRNVITAMRKPWIMGVKEYYAEDRKTVIHSIDGYYPALKLDGIDIDEATFARIQNAIDSRVTFTGNGKSTKSPSLNLFTDLVNDQHGNKMPIRNRATGNPQKVLRSGVKGSKAVIYTHFETAVLCFLNELHASDVAPYDTSLQREIDTLEGEYAQLRQDVKDFKATAKPGKTTAELSAQYDEQLEAMGTKLEALKRQNSNTQAEALETYRSVTALFASASGEKLENLRIKAKQLIRGIVQEITCTVSDWTQAELTIKLTSGKVKPPIRIGSVSGLTYYRGEYQGQMVIAA